MQSIRQKIRFTLLTSFIVTGLFSVVSGQQAPVFSQIMFDHMAINPGFAGSSDMVCLNALAKQDMIGFAGNPESAVFSASTPFRLFGISSGAGLTILTDQLGYNNNLSMNLTYAYQMNVGDGRLGIGIRGGFINAGISGMEWVYPDTELSGGQDELVPQNDDTGIGLDLGMGLYYKTDNLYVGGSVLNFGQPEIQYRQNGVYQMKPHFFVMGGYRMQLANPLFEIQPSLFVQSDGKINSLNLNTNLMYNKRFWGGVSYRVASMVTGMLGIELFNGLRIGYSYDFATSKLINYSTGSHELMLSYCFTIKKEKVPQKYKSIRFL
ncbi:MAG: PorP/SprF family type IX secretion system membrane protein [Bacteroidota bacterium]